MKYIGSKAKIAKEIVPIIQKYINDNNISTYKELFVGGANVIDKIKCKLKIASDIDDGLIELYKTTINNPEALEMLPQRLEREDYYKIRDSIIYAKWYRYAVLLFGSYNSRIYGGCYGAYAKTKDGKIRDYYRESINNYKKQIPSLKDIVFTDGDYRNFNNNQSLIYCDIPYKNSIGFKSEFNHEEFWAWAEEQSKNNIIIVSEYEAPENWKCIWQKQVKTHQNNRNKLVKTEKLFILRESL